MQMYKMFSRGRSRDFMKKKGGGGEGGSWCLLNSEVGAKLEISRSLFNHRSEP